MSRSGVEVRQDITARVLRKKARTEKDVLAARRILGIANILDGMDRASAAKAAGTRDGNTLYFSENQLIHRGAGEAIIKEQKRIWSQDERNTLRDGWDVLLGRINERPSGITKPKWYVSTAKLYAVEAEYFAQAQEIAAHAAPSGVVVTHRTPNHDFVKNENGLYVSYERARDRKPIKPSPSGSPAPIKSEPK